MKITPEQSLTLDYAKAIGIITVVIGHYHGNPFEYYRPYIYHMPLFFFLGGLLINPTRSIFSNSINITKKHFPYLIYTYVFIALLIWAIHAFFPINYTSMWRENIFDSIIYPVKNNFHGGSYFVVAWFLFAYVIVSLLALPVIKVIRATAKSDLWTSIIIICLSIILAYFGMTYLANSYQENNQYWYLNTATQTIVGLSFFLAGHALRPYIFKALHLYGFIAAFLIIYVMHANGLAKPMTMSWSMYPLGFLPHFITALLGIYSVLFLSKVLASTSPMSLFRTIGTQSKSIMSYHIIAFILLDIVFSEIGLFDISKASRFEHYQSPDVWPLYILAGVLLPLLASWYWNKKTTEYKKI